MAWEVWGDVLETSDLTSTNKFQPVTFGGDDIIRAIRVWIIVYNNPTFTDLCLKIYSNQNNTPKKLLATSTNVITKAQLCTLDNGIKEVWFEFDFPVFNKSDKFHLVLNGTGYTGLESSHLSIMKAFPDPVYSSGYVPAIETMLYAPYQYYFIGAEL